MIAISLALVSAGLFGLQRFGTLSEQNPGAHLMRINTVRRDVLSVPTFANAWGAPRPIHRSQI